MLGGHDKNFLPGERSRDTTRDWARLACECPGVSGGGMGWHWPDAGSGTLITTVLGVRPFEICCLWRSPFERNCHCSHYPYHGLGSGQTTGREHSPPIRRKLDWRFTESSVQFCHLVLFHSLRPHGLQHARLPCPSPTPGAYSNSCPSS